MTVYIEKPAVNLREELASLRNQGGYQEQQFWFENAVTNGTFDTDISGWVASSQGSTATWDASGYISITGSETNITQSHYQTITTVVGKTYVASVDLISATSSNRYIKINNVTNPAVDSLVAVNNESFVVGKNVVTFVATSTRTYIHLAVFTVGNNIVCDNISVFETDGTDVVHRMPKGWKPKDVFEDGLLQREGAAHDYEVVYDGFDYFVKPTVAPSATTQTCVIGVKA